MRLGGGRVVAPWSGVLTETLNQFGNSQSKTQRVHVGIWDILGP